MHNERDVSYKICPIRRNTEIEERTKEKQISVIHLMFILSPVLLFLPYFSSIEVEVVQLKSLYLVIIEFSQSPSFHTDNDHYLCFQHFRTRARVFLCGKTLLSCLLYLPHSHVQRFLFLCYFGPFLFSSFNLSASLANIYFSLTLHLLKHLLLRCIQNENRAKQKQYKPNI